MVQLKSTQLVLGLPDVLYNVGKQNFYLKINLKIAVKK